MNELAQTCDRLTQENAELRDQVSVLSASAAPSVSGPATEPAMTAARGQHRRALDRAVSRRAIGKAAGAAAAGVVGAAAFAELARSAGPARRAIGGAHEDATAEPEAEAELLSDRAGAPSVIDVSVASPGAVLVARNTGVGVGGVFAGPAGQIQLTPGKRATHPAGGKQGALYADSKGRLWFCTRGGTRAAWRQLG